MKTTFFRLKKRQSSKVCDIVAYCEKHNTDMQCTGLVKSKANGKPELLPEQCAEWHPQELLPIQEEGYKICLQLEDNPPLLTITEGEIGVDLLLRMNGENHHIDAKGQRTLRCVVDHHNSESGLFICTGFDCDLNQVTDESQVGMDSTFDSLLGEECSSAELFLHLEGRED